MGKSTISMAMFNSYVSLPEGKLTVGLLDPDNSLVSMDTKNLPTHICQGNSLLIYQRVTHALCQKSIRSSNLLTIQIH